MIKKKYIVAGNLGEYNDFMRRHQDTPNEVYVYVDNHLQLIGRTNIEGYYTGTYYKRHDIDKIKDIITTSKYINTTGYIAEPVIELCNNHVIDRRNYKEINDNAMIDSMRDRD
jgi:hypothetical protein